MEKKVINQGVKTSESGVKIRKSTVPGVTLVEYKENVPEGYSAPDILRRPISLTLQEGKIANFKAVVQGNPKPSVVWSFKEKHLTNDNHYKIYQDTVTKEHILQVIQLTSDDAGSYKCIFSNEYGEARCVTNLNIIEVGFKKKMKKPEATKENLPDPTAFRKMLRKRALPVKRQDNVPDEKVWEILMNADKKDYEKICLQYGITDFRGMLTRLKQMKIEREEKQAAYLKYIGNLKHIETKADGSANFGFDMELKNPNLSIFLYKDEEMIPLSMSEDGKHQLRHVGKRYNFCIKDLQPEDVGMYKINVEDTSVFATEVDIYHIPVAFKQSLQECRCNETEDAVFGSTISVPLPVEWLYKNLTLEDSDKYQITVSPDGLTHRLIVKDVTLEDRGVYTIIAGARSSSAHLTEQNNQQGSFQRKEYSLKTLISLVPMICSPCAHHTQPVPLYFILSKYTSSYYPQKEAHTHRKILENSINKNLDATSRHSRSEKNSSDINLKQDLDGLKKDNTKGITDRLTQNKDITKDGLKERNNLSEADRTRFDRRGLQDSTGDGLYGNDLSDIGKYDRMGKDSSVIGRDGLGRMDEDGLDRLHSQGKDNRGRLDGMGKDGKGSLVGMNEEEMGIGGKGRQDGIERYGGDRLGGIGADGMEIWDAMGKSGKGQLIGEGKDRIDNLGEMGKDASGILGGLGKHGKVQLGGMGLEFTDNLEGVGKNGQDSLYGMGNEGNSGWGGMRKEGKGTGGKDRPDGLGKGGMAGLDGMGKGGVAGLDGMGKGGMGGLDGMAKGGVAGLDGMGKGGMAGVDGMGKGGMGDLDGMGKSGVAGVDGMGKGGMGGFDGMGKGGLGGLDGMGKGGIGALDGMGKGGVAGVDGMGKGGMGALDGMGKGGVAGVDGMGKGGMGALDGMGKGGMGGLDGMGKGGVAGVDGMGKGGMGALDGMGKGGMGGLDGMGKGGVAGLDGMGKRGMGGLDGMGKGGVAGVDGMGKGGMGALDGMGKGGMGGLDGMGKGGVAGLDGMGKRGMGGLDGMGKGGVAGLDGMGKGSVGGLDGMGKGGMAGLDGRGTAGKGRLEGTGKNGKDVWDGLGKDMKGRENAKDKWNEMEESDLHVLEGMGKDGKSRLFGVGKDGNNSLVGISKDQLDGSGPTDMKGSSSKSRLNTFGSNQDKSGLEGYSGSAFSGIAAKDGGGFEAINALSTAGELSSMSGSAGDVNDGSTSSAGNKRGLLGDGQMSIRDESMDESKRGLLASDLSQSHARRRHRKLSESELTGNKKLQSKEAAHYFKSGLSDISAKKGEAAELCCVTKNEEAQGSWFKDGKKITSGNGKVITKEGAVQKLTFGHIQEEDSGIYTFEADGGRTEASLFVEDPPEFDQDMLDQLGKKPILVKAGHTATVKVQFKGKQPMKVSWYKDGDELFNDKRIKIDNAGNFTRLSISNCNRKDSGILTAKLKNESGTASTDNISLCVIDKPQAPQGPIEVLESSESCISFKWKPPKDDGGKPITNYIIERQLVGRNTWTKVGEKDVSETTFSVPKVQPGKNYKFKVWAVNSEGVSEALLSDTITAGRRDVPGPVATPKILNANSKSITLSWTPPKKIGSSRLIGYLIEKRKEGSNTWIVVTDHPITEKKWTVTDVVEGLKYEFRVIAVNSSGLGEPSCETEAVFAREPIRPPGTVRDLRMIDSTYSTISLAWTPPTYQDNGEAKGYIVEMKSSGSAAWTRCNPVPIALNSYTVKNLKPMGSYFLRVTAVNDGGMGEPVELDSYVLAMPPPVAPKFKLDESFKSFMIIKEGNSFQVQLPFQASPPPEVIWLKDGSPLRKQVAVTNTNDGTQLFIPACQRSDSGIYSIILKNPFGQDSFSFEIRATAIPKPPGLLTLNENVPNTVTVSWEPSRDEPLDDHLHYVVKKRDSSRQMWHTIGDNIFNNKFTVINVIPGRKYYFRVLAKNDLGYSDPSDMVEPWGITKQRDSITLKLPDYKGVNNISAPEFTVKLKTHTAPTGSDVCMSCAVKGYPPPNVTWFKDNISITNNANFWSTNVCGVCSLCIFAASPKQSGEYMAFAENMAGRATCSTRLNIRD
ncbi:immunoglobulin-like and fibronectin type III domain-containing protein 1 [Hypanus sabinus]|uniref:immunoglobulin-like and fibronectin type III domain-containing protein 1 n=1 Tax=Hypanus sabinus TaxID=79690 RepID=UPI0028C43EBF|nr:immunoglobulin-like and fibronectin type III domain-containing protein 1 [Hypanus sabinus]